MSRIATLLLAIAAVVLAGCAGRQTVERSAPDFQWAPAPAVLPAGAQIAVLDGDPSSAVPFTIRLRFPDGYRIAPHTHPTDEHVTVIQGTFAVGMGERFDAAAMRQLGPGGYVTAPANQAHFAAAQGETIVQIHANGPFALTYVNPADAPRTATK